MLPITTNSLSKWTVTKLAPVKSLLKLVCCAKELPSYIKGFPLPSTIKSLSVPVKLYLANLTLPEPPKLVPPPVSSVHPLPVDRQS